MSEQYPEQKDNTLNLEQRELFAAIPLEIPDVKGYKEVEIKENGEPLIAVGPFSGNNLDRLFTSSIYYGERRDSPYGRNTLDSSLVTTFVREAAARKLLTAESLLPDNHHLILLDTYRSTDVQRSLYDQYAEPLRNQHPDWTEEQVEKVTSDFVSPPSTNPVKPSTHNTGGSIDLAIYRLPQHIDMRVKDINKQIQQLDQKSGWQEIYKLEMERIGLIAKNAELLNFGTQFDWGGPEAALNYFEVQSTQRQLTKDEEEAQQNRRLLYNVMIQAGFQPFATEWWHFNAPETQMGARTGNLPFARYGAAELSEANLAHEQMRQRHIEGTEALQSTLADSKLGKQLSTAGALNDTLAVAKKGAVSLGVAYQVTNLPKAAVIRPPGEEKVA